MSLQRKDLAVTTPDCSSEEWRLVEGWPYEVSSLGKVRRLGKKVNWKAVRELKPQRNQKGYLIVNFSDGPRKLSCVIHCLVAKAFLGPCPPGYEINHIDANRGNPALRNLEYVTHRENIQYSVSNGRWPVGSRRYNSKLTEEAVREIRSGPTDYATVRLLARKFGVTEPTILKVINRENWKHI